MALVSTFLNLPPAASLPEVPSLTFCGHLEEDQARGHCLRTRLGVFVAAEHYDVSNGGAFSWVVCQD